jgi:hypothetical protein
MQKAIKIVGWVFSVMAAAIFLMGSWVQLNFDPAASSGGPISYPVWFHTLIGVGFLVATILHLIPRTAFALFGAILMSAFFGGIIGTHLLLDDGQWVSRMLMGLLPWFGLYLRDPAFNNLMSFWRTGDA